MSPREIPVLPLVLKHPFGAEWAEKIRESIRRELEYGPYYGPHQLPGPLERSVRVQVRPFEVSIGTNVEYAPRR